MLQGSLEVHYGPMFSDKTSSLIDLYLELVARGDNVVCVKPSLDNRYGDDGKLYSHNGRSAPAFLIDGQKPESIYQLFPPGCTHLIVDESNFLPAAGIDIIRNLLDQGVNIYVAGLDLDFSGQNFGSTLELIQWAEALAAEGRGAVVKHTAICHACQGEATMSYAKQIMTRQVLVAAADGYGAACPSCHPTLNRG